LCSAGSLLERSAGLRRRTNAEVTRTLVEMVKWIDGQGLELDDVHLSRPTLEDVFIELTGKKLRD
jgi:hypothetical protein